MLGLLVLHLTSKYVSETIWRLSFDDMGVRAFYAWMSAKESAHREISKANKAIEALF